MESKVPVVRTFGVLGFIFPRATTLPWLFMAGLLVNPGLVGCESGGDAKGDDASATTDDGTHSQQGGEDSRAREDVEGGVGSDAALSQPACVWNQAYQENYDKDGIDTILANARGCYVLVDPFGSEEAREAIAGIKAAGNVVGCYMSSGTCEEWRGDWAQTRDHCVSEQWEEWPGEYFVDEPASGLITAMNARIDRLAMWGCDMVEFDNMDWAFDEENRQTYGFSASESDAETYNQTLCDYTHSLGLGCMAKSTRQGAERFDGATFESYADDKDWWPHSHLQDMLDEGKLGIVVHYDETDCDGVLAEYRAAYGAAVSFICEDRATGRYVHYD